MVEGGVKVKGGMRDKGVDRKTGNSDWVWLFVGSGNE